jgi:sugar lactone lactonase YvrE
VPPAQRDTGRLVAAGIGFGEGPRWHDGVLWFSDIARGDVCRVADDPDCEAAVIVGRISG